MKHQLDAPSAMLQPDPAMIARFAEAVFGYTEGFVAVRMLREKGMPPAQPWTDMLPADGTLGPGLARLAPRAARDRRALYVVPGTLEEPGNATADRIAETAVVLVDLDDGDVEAKRRHLESHLGQPILIVASGGMVDGQEKLHLYWRLTEAARGADLQRAVGLREVIARKVGGDPSVARLHQPIRVAGSLHLKHGRAALCRIVAETGRDHDLDELAAAIAAMPAIAPLAPEAAPYRQTATGPTATTLMTQVVHENCADGITRFDALSKVIGHWIRQARQRHVDLAGAWTAVSDHNAAMIRPPWPAARLRQDFDRLLHRDIAANGPLPSTASTGMPDEGGARIVPPEHSEDALAEAFVHRRGRDWCHVATWGRWLHWAGTHWSDDECGAVRDAVRHVCRADADACEKPGDARRLASDRTIRAVTAIAAADPRIARSPAVWDGEPGLLNTPAGIVDLDSGEVLAHDRSLHLTQITRASPGHGCPRWLAFLDEITGGDRELVAYLGRLAGYCLTGITHEQVFFFLHGHGTNGKSVFRNTLAAVMGGYARTAAAETFMASRNPLHPTDLAGLRGARLVHVTETEANRAWAESRIKAITGGDPIAARFMHRDFFEFTPTFKLIVAGNYRPVLGGVGEAMRRRLHLVPFEVTIPEERCDLQLEAKLRAEQDGVLGWMIEGCADWRRQGLAPPDRVLAASRDYFADEDVVGQWIAEQCEVGDALSAPSAALYASWSAYAAAAGFETGSRKTLADALVTRGFRKIRTGRARGWSGIALRGTGAAP